MEVEAVTRVEQVTRMERVARPATTGRVEMAGQRERPGARGRHRPAVEGEAALLSTIAAGDIGSLPEMMEMSAGDAAGDSVFGVDLQRAVILQQIFGPPVCRRPRRARLVRL
jgi:hypothetical protein